jgi:hypothetical protein
MHVTRSAARALRLCVVLAISAIAAAPLAAQYPLAPSPVLDLSRLTTTPALSGYLAARQTRRQDSTTFSISRIRVTAQAHPLPFLAVRIQGGISNNGIGNSSSSVGTFAFSDAYVQLVPTNPHRFQALRPSLIVGQFKMPFSLEYLTPYSHLLTISRSQAVDAFSFKRDIGVMGQVHLSRYVTVDGAVANGSGSNTTSNPDGRELAMARVTVTPIPQLAIAGKWAGQGADHRWGYDARFVAGQAVVEGEVIQRAAGPGAAVSDESGGYALAAYKVLPWLQPLVKWEQFHQTLAPTNPPPGGGAPAASSELRSTWTTYGVNVVAARDRVRFQLDWIVKSDHADGQANELLAQVIAIY